MKAWNQAAELRRSQIESGIDITFCDVFVPYYSARVESAQSRRILEIGCGTGHLAKALASDGRTLHAIEPSEDMHRVAADVLLGSHVDLQKLRMEDYRPQEPFDLAIAHLVVHMVDAVPAFLAATRRALSPGGTLLMSLPHPCFWNNYREYIPRDRYRYMRQEYAEATLTITKDPSNSIHGIPYFHRPLQDYIKAIILAELCIVDIDEIYPEPGIEAKYGSEWKEPRYVVLSCSVIGE